MIENAKRRRATWQGAAGVLLAPFCLVAIGQIENAGPGLSGVLEHSVVIALVVLGLALSVCGIWRLGVARDRRWDLRGILALCLMLVAGLPTLGLLLFLVVTGFMGPLFGGH